MWLNATLAAAIIAAGAAPACARGMAGGFAGPAAAHGFGSISSRPLHIVSAPFVFGPAFPQARFGEARFEGWSGGAYSADVAASEDLGIDPDNMIFRVQEPFGPGDLGRPGPTNGPGSMGAWEGPPPSYAYGPSDMDDR